MWKHSRIVNTHSRLSSCPQLSLIRNRTQNPPNPGRRRINIFRSNLSFHIIYLEFDSWVIGRSKYDQNAQHGFQFLFQRPLSLLWNFYQLFQCTRATVFLVKHENPLLSQSANCQSGAHADPCSNFVRSTLRFLPFLVIGEFLKAKTPIFFKRIFFTNLTFIRNNW